MWAHMIVDVIGQATWDRLGPAQRRLIRTYDNKFETIQYNNQEAIRILEDHIEQCSDGMQLLAICA